MNEDEHDTKEWPSSYDHFYYDYCIANSLCEFNSIKNFFKKYGINVKDVYCGYLYLFELVIINIVYNLESILEERDIFELIHWGDVTIGNTELAKIIKSHPEIESIYSLLSIRRTLSKHRFKNKYDEDEIVQQLNNLNYILNKTNLYLMKKYKISKNEKNQGKETELILDWILGKYNWIELPSVMLTDKQKEPYPEFAGHPIFYLMPPNMKQAYYLQDNRIKLNEKNYTKGFSLSLLYLYDNLISEQSTIFEQDLLDVDSWLKLHEVGGRIREKIIKNNILFTRLFNEERPSADKTFFKKDVISNYEELRLVLRGRNIRVVANRYSGDYPKRESLFIHFLLGAIRLYEFNQRDKPEIVEFKEISKNGNWIEYSYAIYFPVFGGFWDASNWLLFDKLCVESSWEKSFFKMHIDQYIKIFGEKISFRRCDIEVDDIKEDILKRYIEENDFQIKAIKDQKTKISECIGLLGEFLAGLYLIKEKNVNHLSKLDFHKDLEDTDIDVIGETGDSVIIFQVKASISFDLIEREKILNNFNKILKNIVDEKIEHKNIELILFILNDVPPEKEINSLWDDEKIFEGGYITEDIIKNKMQEVISYFKERNITIKFLEEFKKKLENEGQYRGLLNKLNIIFPKNEFEENS